MSDPIRIVGIWKEDGSYYYSDDSGNPRTGEMNPPEHLTAALVGCTGRTMQMLLERMKIKHQGFTVTGVTRKTGDEPARLNPFTLDATVHGVELSEAQKTRLLDLTKKYCLVTQTLEQGADISFDMSLIR